MDSPLPHPLLEVLTTRVVIAGRQTMPRHWKIPRRILEVHDLIAVESGMGVVRIGSSIYPLKPGSWSLLPAGIPHDASQDPERPLTLRVIHFSLESEGAPNLLHQIRDPGKLDFPEHEQADWLFGFILQLFKEEDPTAQLLANRSLDLLLAVILRNAAAESIPDSRIARAVSLIQRDYTHKWTTRELGRRVGLSSEYFRELFIRTLGASPRHYLRQIRLHHARRLLRHSRMTMQEIADATGWENASTFARTFKEVVGQTPGTFREISIKKQW